MRFSHKVSVFDDPHASSSERTTDFVQSCWLVRFLSLIGIHADEPSARTSPCRVRCKRLFSPLGIFFLVSFVYSVVTQIANGVVNKLSVVCMLCNILSLCLWLLMLSKADSIHALLRGIAEAEDMLQLKSRGGTAVVNAGVCLVLLLPVLYSVLQAICTAYDGPKQYACLLLFQVLDIHDPVPVYALLLLCNALFFTAKFFVSCSFLVIHGTFCWKMKQHLASVHDSIAEAALPLVRVTRTYAFLVDQCKRLDACFSVALVFMLSTFFSTMYTGFAVLLSSDIPPDLSALADALVILVLASASVVILSWLSSGVPCEMTRVRVRCREVCLQYRARETPDDEPLKLMEALSGIKPLYLSVAGVHYLDKRTILAAFGCALTYCILIIQMKRY